MDSQAGEKCDRQERRPDIWFDGHASTSTRFLRGR
jgi:hypothetical protein